MKKIKFNIINMDNWDRKECFEHYYNNAKCTYSLTVDMDITNSSLKKLNEEKNGLDSIDVKLLKTIKKLGPVGLKSLAASIGEEESTIEDVYEPFLLQSGYIKRTSRGRIVTDKAIKYLEEF